MLSFARKKFLAAVAACVACVGVLAGAAGYFGYQYYHYPVDRKGYQEYLSHKKEQEARLQNLLADNEKMLRDMSEIHTLETKLRRAVIRNGGDRDFRKAWTMRAARAAVPARLTWDRAARWRTSA